MDIGVHGADEARPGGRSVVHGKSPSSNISILMDHFGLSELICIKASSTQAWKLSAVLIGYAAMDDAAAFRSLFDANHSRVRALLVRIVGREAEDLTQVVFAKAAEALPRFRGQAQPSTWLYRIAANVGSDWLRSRAAQEAKVTVGLSGTEDQDTNEPCASSDRGNCQRSPEQELIRKEMNDCIRQVIGQLPENHRSVLVLAELGGLSDDEVAQTFGISLNNAKVRLHRARAQLKQALSGRCDFYRNEDNELACEPKPGACGSSSRSKSCADAA